MNRRGQKDQNGKDAVDFFKVAAWEGLGHSCQQYLSKGRKVAVVGQVSVRTYQAQDGTTRADMNVLAHDVEFLTPRDQQSAPAPAAPAAQAVSMEDGELPFDRLGERR